MKATVKKVKKPAKAAAPKKAAPKAKVAAPKKAATKTKVVDKKAAAKVAAKKAATKVKVAKAKAKAVKFKTGLEKAKAKAATMIASIKPKAKAASQPKFVPIEWDKLPQGTPIEGVVRPASRPAVTPSPSNKQTDTAAFKKWFGKSKVVDSKGKPMVVYHGSPTGGFTAFSHTKIDAHHIGFFFTSNREMAQTYVGQGTWSDPTPTHDTPKYSLKTVLELWPKFAQVFLYLKSLSPEFVSLIREYWSLLTPYMNKDKVEKYRIALDRALEDPVKLIKFDPHVKSQMILANPFGFANEYEILSELIHYTYVAYEFPTTAEKALALSVYAHAKKGLANDYRGIFMPNEYDLLNDRERSKVPDSKWERTQEIEAAVHQIPLGKPALLFRAGKELFFDPSSDKAEAERIREYATQPSVNLFSDPGIYAVYLSLQNPLVVDAHGSWWSKIEVKVGNKTATASTDQLSYAAKSLGHDGVIILNVHDDGGKYFSKTSGSGDVYIAFEPTQIKSASVNRGTFDPTDPDIRHNPERTYTPPPAVAAAARKGLELRAKQPPSNRCCTPVGLRRASQLANRQPVSVDTLKRMRSYFQRHAVDSRSPRWGTDSKGWIAWLAWGGDPAREWCNEILSKLGE